MRENFLLRLPAKEMALLKSVANRSAISINELCKNILSLYLQKNRDNGKWSGLIDIISKSSISSDIEGIILFGSVAKGIDSEDSDLDLLFALSSKKKLSRKLYRIWDEEICNKLDLLSFSSGKEVSPHFAAIPTSTNETGGLWLEMAISGIIIWDKNSNCEKFLINLREQIASGAFVRKTTHGHPYWKRVDNNL